MTSSEPQLRTLLISEIFPPAHGGSGRWFAELYSRLDRHRYVIAAGDRDPRHREADQTLSARLDIRRLDLGSPSWGLRSLTGLRFYLRTHWALLRLIRSERITHLHCGRCLPEGVMGLLLRLRTGLPYLCYVHGEDIQTAAESRELSWLIRRVFARADRLIANSRNTARLLTDDWAVPADKIVVLHPGMDASRFVPAPSDAQARESLGWGDRTVVLTVGRLQRRKGQDMMIRALPTLIREHPNLLYAIVGGGEEREALVALAGQVCVSDRVHFLGEVDDETMIRCYQQCTLFALPNRTEGSDIEGFGMVLAEAQACARPVLAGDSGGTRETMIVGETGVIADCTNSDALAAAVSELLKHPEQLTHMGLAAREHVQTAFDWPVHVAKATQVFEDFMMGSRHG